MNTIALLGLTVLLQIEPQSVRLEKYDKHCEQVREMAISSLRTKINGTESSIRLWTTTKSGKNSPKSSKSSVDPRVEAKKKELASLQRLLEKQLDNQKNKVRDAPLDIANIEVGSIGTFPGSLNSFATEVRVFQIVNPREMVVELVEFSSAGSTTRERKHHFWVEGVPTDGLVDGKEIKATQCFDVVGTKTYATAGGSQRTIFRLAPIAAKQP